MHINLNLTVDYTCKCFVYAVPYCLFCMSVLVTVTLASVIAYGMLRIVYESG